jgi:cardiolipin synthase
MYNLLYKAWISALALFSIAALTDVLDGALARYLSQETELGACLDPLADKLLIISSYVTLFAMDIPYTAIPLWFVVFVFAKEAIQVCAGLYIYLWYPIVSIKPTRLGKATTVFQSICIVLFFVHAHMPFLTSHIYSSLLWGALVLNGVTLIHYGYIAYKGWMSCFVRK